jgi:hypothetical protein
MSNGIPGNILSDGLGNVLTQLFVTTSYSQTASVFTTSNTFALNVTNSQYSVSSSWSSSSISSSFSTYGTYSSQSINAQTSSLSFTSLQSNYSIGGGSSSFSISSSWATQSIYSTSASFIYPSAGTVLNAGYLTGSATMGGYGFLSANEFNNFILSLTSSIIQFNSLLSKLRSQGLIS